MRTIEIMGALLVGATIGCAGGDVGAEGFAPGLGGAEAAETGEAEADSSDGPAEADIDEWIFALGYLELPPEVANTELDCEAAECEPMQEGDESCVYAKFTETGHFADLIAFAPDSVALWPGSIVDGLDASNGLLTPLVMPRTPLAYSVSLANLVGSPVAEMASPSMSEFRDTRNALLASGVTGQIDAKLSFEIERVYNESHLSLSIGTSVGWGGIKLANLFEFEDESRQTKILVDFTQAYYTIDAEPPANPSDLFADEVTIDDLDDVMGDENPPMYVQSITYGRRVLFAFESAYSEEEVRNAFAASFNALFVSGSVDVDVAVSEIVDNSRISAFVLGGGASDAVKVVGGIEGLLEFLADGANYSSDSPGSPIAYKLAYLDNTETQFALTTDYTTKTCVGTHADVTIALTQLESVGDVEQDGGLDVYGQLEARLAPAGDVDPCRADAPDWQMIFDRDASQDLSVFGTWVPPSPLEVTLYDVEIDPQASLCLRGWMKEDDSGFLSSDDDLGSDALGPIAFEHGWLGEHTLQFVGDGPECHATFRVDF